jgi:subtilisin family serine protease
MKKRIALIISIVSFTQVFGQVSPGKFRLELANKNDTTYSISKPEEFLSIKTIQRRNKYGIPITIQDIPVVQSYIDSLETLGLHVISRSKWMNAVIVESTDTALLDTITNLSFIVSKEKSFTPSKIKSTGFDKLTDPVTTKSTIMYGNTHRQIMMLNGHCLHEQGYQGEGMLIAVIDAGFTNVDSFTAFDSIRNNGQILATRDFVDKGTGVYEDHTHGMKVLSTMAGNIPGQFLGTAPKADYLLLRSEIGDDFEYKIEEDWWIEAAEFADSMGADIITSSLGYVEYMDSTQNYTYENMNGNTARITRAADIAASKGMLVVTSAGNYRKEPWHYISAPADADSVIAVGAIKSDFTITDFSSAGPSYDGRVKPNVVAMGEGTAVIQDGGYIGTGKGTSYSGPIIAGMAACLWQSFPDASNMEIINAIDKSADRYTNPDSLYGYGLPNFYHAFLYLTAPDTLFECELYSAGPGLTDAIAIIEVGPNPFLDYINIHFKRKFGKNAQVRLYNACGILLFQETINIAITKTVKLMPDSYLKPGIYFLTVQHAGNTHNFKLMKPSD